MISLASLFRLVTEAGLKLKEKVHNMFFVEKKLLIPLRKIDKENLCISEQTMRSLQI